MKPDKKKINIPFFEGKAATAESVIERLEGINRDMPNGDQKLIALNLLLRILQLSELQNQYQRFKLTEENKELKRAHALLTKARKKQMQ